MIRLISEFNMSRVVWWRGLVRFVWLGLNVLCLVLRLGISMVLMVDRCRGFDVRRRRLCRRLDLGLILMI